MTAFTLAFGFLLLPALAPLAAQSPEAPVSDRWDARLTDSRGEVTVFEAGGDPLGLPAEKDLPLEEGDRVVTGEDSSAEIAIDAESVLTLGANSDFTFRSSRKADAVLGLSLGTLLARLKTLLGGQNLQVRTPTAVMAVRGTEFGVEVSPEETHIGVFDEGKLEVRGESGAPELLRNSQETSVRRGQAPRAAAQLRRLVRHRLQVRAFRRRLILLRRSWKPLPSRGRAELRERVKAKMRGRREELRERRRLRDLRKDEGAKRRAEERKSRREKMEKRRAKIREGLRR